jgi:hypothetical protein
MPGKDKILVAAWRVSSVCLFSALLQSSIQGPWSLWLFTPSSCINPNLSFHQLTTTQTRSSHTHSKEQIQCIATAPWHHFSHRNNHTRAPKLKRVGGAMQRSISGLIQHGSGATVVDV